MTIVFGGGESGAFIPSDSSAVETLLMYDTSFSRCALRASGSGYNESFTFTGLTDFFVHAQIGSQDYPSGTVYPLVMVTGGGVEAIRLAYARGSDTLTLEYWNGTVYVSAGSFAIDLSATTHDIDIHPVVNTASGSIDVYVAGTRRINATGLNLSGIASIVKFREYGASSSPHISQVVTSTESTIGFRLKTAPATGAGATTDWTGTYAEIDEVVRSDADFINSSTNGQVELFAHGVTVPTGYKVKAVIVTARAKRGSTGPANLQLALRSGGTTYFSSSQALDLGYGANVAVWETDPATSAAFTASAITALQFGVKAVT